jgi:micrococcal nuclease
MFEYEGEVISVHDGDSFKVVIDLGFGLFSKQDVRIYGIDAPEKNKTLQKAAALKSLAFVESKILGKTVRLHTMKPKDKYGRYLAKVTYVDNDNLTYDLSTELVRTGLAKTYYGGKKDD